MKIELEQVKPADIEKRSFEIIDLNCPMILTANLRQSLKERFTHLLILIMLITCAFQKMLLARHWKALKMEPA